MEVVLLAKVKLTNPFKPSVFILFLRENNKYLKIIRESLAGSLFVLYLCCDKFKIKVIMKTISIIILLLSVFFVIYCYYPKKKVKKVSEHCFYNENGNKYLTLFKPFDTQFYSLDFHVQTRKEKTDIIEYIYVPNLKLK